MTTIRRDGLDTPFGEWIRNRDGLDSIRERLSVTDSDYWIHQYRAKVDRVGERMIDNIMLVELKTNWRDLPFAQRDTLRLIDGVLLEACWDKSRRNVKTKRLVFGSEVRLVRCYGVYVLRLQGERPDDGGRISWHGTQVDEDTLVRILRFEIDPRNLRARSDRRHHTSRNPVLQLALGSVANA